MSLFSRVAALVTSAPDSPETPASPAVPISFRNPEVDWAALVQTVHRGEQDGLDELYRLFARGIRLQLCRLLGPEELDDRVHDTFLIIAAAIRNNDLRDPERLMAFVRTIVRRQASVYITENITRRRTEDPPGQGPEPCDANSDPEQSMMSDEAHNLVLEVLTHMNDRDREILTRFYLQEESPAEICRRMGLSQSQFRLLKSRAKAKFGLLGKKNVRQRSLSSLLVRTSAPNSH